MSESSHIRYYRGKLAEAKDELLNKEISMNRYNEKVRELRRQLHKFGVEI